MNKLLFSLIGLLICGAPLVAETEEGGTKDARPRLAHMQPEQWARGVSPSLTAIQLEFSESMHPAFSAVAGSSSLAPEKIGQLSLSRNRKTFTIPVKVSPGRVYVLAINERQSDGVGFQNSKGVSAASDYVIFQTSGDVQKTDQPPHVEELRVIPGKGDERAVTIRVQFDRAMDSSTEGFTVLGANSGALIKTEKPAYEKKSRSWRVELVPTDEPIIIWINKGNRPGFRSENHIPCWPQKLIYEALAGAVVPEARE